jgi:purine-nucleoside phosphorylase
MQLLRSSAKINCGTPQNFLNNVLRMRAECQQAVEYIRARIPYSPTIGVILGSGLGDYADAFPDPHIIPYAEIPNFPRSTVAGHKGRLVLQPFGAFAVVVMQGRFHYYEGYSLAQVTFPIRVMGALGIHRLIVTNAAGGINPRFRPGDLMLITDHINLMGVNPLCGPHEDSDGPRFPDMTEAYNQEDGQFFEQIAGPLGIGLQQGIYVGLSGPSYETPAEIRMLRTLGADAVGMSTVPEVIVANQMGLRVSGISCISNMAAGMGTGKLSHQEVMETSERVKTQFIALLDKTIQVLGRSAR